MGKNKNKKNKKKNKGGKKKGGKKNKNPVGQAPTYTQRDGVQDFLDETAMKSFERYGCIMFASPGETMREQFKVQIATSLAVDEDLVDKIVEEYIALEHPKRAVKYVGGRSTPEDCAARIKEVMEEDKTFNIYTTENGKWCTFDPSPELIEDENYREEQLNEIMRGKKMQEKRTEQFFRSEMRKRVEKARMEGTEEGQRILMEAEEPFEAVEYRAESATKSIEEFQEKIEELKRARELALRKAEKMRSEGLDVVQPTEIAINSEVLAAAEGRRTEVQEELTKLSEMEKDRVWPDDLGKATAQKMQQPQVQAHVVPRAAPLDSALFDAGEIPRPRVTDSNNSNKGSDKGKEEELN